MNDQFSKMIDETDKMSGLDLSKVLDITKEEDLPDEKEVKLEPVIHTKLVDPDVFDIETTIFPDWFAENHMNLPNIGHVKASVQAVNPRRDLIFKIPDPDGGIYDDKPECRLKMFQDADKISVLNVKAYEMILFNNNAFVIKYDIGDGKFLTCYGVKTGIIVTFSVRINRLIIPYSKIKVGKKAKGVNIVQPDIIQIQEKIEKDANIENIIILYTQIKKYTAAITTIKSAIKWFTEKSKTVTDINHLIKIDEVIISMIK